MDDPLFAAGLVVLLGGMSSFLAGAFGPIIVGAAAMVVAVLEQRAEDDATESDPTDKTSCPNCGARNESERETCYYCDASL
ncbi:hypothetical protein [Halomarina rubra]|uniref:Zinc ribbon domain-containing protein n=1 Tax=Halomarina rubra TaxID=2071873 RepID=A0ABD6B225_9EURY|nr:hypothetical protein [Halomarina rubra]